LAQAKKQTNDKLPLKSILLTSETLAPEIKDYIAGAFDVETYNFYGAAERVCYIFTCEKGSYHIQPEYGYTELLPGKGDEKKIVSTGLWNHAMPLIRYDTGDNVIESNHVCDCGRHFQTVKVISGREGDYIKTPAGKIFGHVILTHIFHVICGIDSFTESQIIHDELDHLSIKYVSADGLSEEIVTKYVKKLKEHIGEEMKIDFIPVDEIEKTAAGKHKFVISQVEA
jgi:phenylacetate-CoA ligase